MGYMYRERERKNVEFIKGVEKELEGKYRRLRVRRFFLSREQSTRRYTPV